MALYLSAVWLSNSNQMGILQVNPDLYWIKKGSYHSVFHCTTILDLTFISILTINSSTIKLFRIRIYKLMFITWTCFTINVNVPCWQPYNTVSRSSINESLCYYLEDWVELLKTILHTKPSAHVLYAHKITSGHCLLDAW